ncbi:APC family permease [Bifidobacterium cuniculi]|uniref:Putative amino acid transporter n=1 Tax=Bifidobacterium cuniculi TaxID=1688 RepID=A0A087AZJ7_9BIFI|nr:APC family permease [Bifidobacterium cuniculi]KFI64197.1 putative amino acid transporter [Bifidobacterium cuniculi]
MTDQTLNTLARPAIRNTNDAGRGRPAGLGTPAITMMVVAAAAPLTVLGGSTPLGILNGNGAAFPVTFLVVGLALLLFSVGFSAMGRHTGDSGAFFNAIGRGLGPTSGVGAATLALFTYGMIQSAITCFLGMQLSASLESLLGIAVPWWGCSLAALAAVAFLGYRSIGMSANVLNVLIAGEIGVAVLLCVGVFSQVGVSGTALSATFHPAALTQGAPGVAVIFAIASFVGFESTAIYRSEARDPDRTVPRATYIAVAFVTVLYLVSSYAVVTAWSDVDDPAAADALLGAGDMLQQVAARYVGQWCAALISVLIVTSLFAAVLSFHNVLSRYLQHMGAAHALPASLGRLDPRTQSPARASLAVSAVSLTVVGGVVSSGIDPFTQAFSWFSGAAVLGFVVLLFLACAAVIAFFARRPALRVREGALRTQVVPGAALVLLAGILGCALFNFADLVGETGSGGVPVFGAVCGTLVACVAASLLLGVAGAAVMRRVDPGAREALEASMR